MILALAGAHQEPDSQGKVRFGREIPDGLVDAISLRYCGSCADAGQIAAARKARREMPMFTA